MIAADSSVVVDLLQGVDSPECDQLKQYLRNGQAVMAPATLTELLSDPSRTGDMQHVLKEFRLLALTEGYWERAGVLRAKVRRAGRKAALGDALIAQACIDANVALLTRDADFAAYVKIGGLKLA